MIEIPKIVSVDDHVVEPAHLFERWLPARYRAAGPRGLPLSTASGAIPAL